MSSGIQTTPDTGFQGQESKILGYLAWNVALALLLYKLPILANVHNLAAVLVGLSFAARRQFEHIVYAGAYVVGAELVWRVCHATLSYESGKYSLVVIFGVGLMALDRWRPSMPVIIYFTLLIPSAVLTLFFYSPEEARQQISFYLAGPLALTVTTLYLSNIRMSFEQVLRVLVVLLGPIAGLAAITLYATVTAPTIVFTSESNFVTSGGFGPNQVSSILGMGVFAAMFLALFAPCARMLRLVFVGLMLFCAMQSAMTFSRNGLYVAAAAAICIAVFGFKLPEIRTRFLVGGLAVALIGAVVIYPRLNRFTGGMLEHRFAETNTSHRDELVWDDFRIWRENPLFGVGPGNARNYRVGETHFSAHTEFSRMFAEHGAFGIMALLMLVGMSVTRFRKLHDVRVRTLVSTLLVWTILYMTANAMRVAAPSFAFGLAFVDVVPKQRRLVRIRMIKKAA